MKEDMPSSLIHNEEHVKKYTDAIQQARFEGADAFQSWFDASQGVEESVVRGFWDFSIHILTHRVCEYINSPSDLTALEIGYGGGRLLNAACCYFKRAIGIDIHSEQATVEAFLKGQNRDNFHLIKTGGRTIDADSGSIDFVYSFIVLQHLPNFTIFESYLNETWRVLMPGGVAQLYFGRYSTLSLREQLRYFWKGYKEIKASVNHISLVVQSRKARHLSESLGFKVIDTGSSYKKVPDGYPFHRGGQNYITLFKK